MGKYRSNSRRSREEWSEPKPSKLLIHEPPVEVMPSLARAIGLAEAAVLQQIHYWLFLNRQLSDHWYEGRVWMYGTPQELMEYGFQFLSPRGLQKALGRLRKAGLVLTGCFNRMRADRTLWYTIDYEAVEELSRSIEPICPKRVNDQPQKGTPIPETTYREPIRDPGAHGKADYVEKFDRDGWEYTVWRRPKSGVLNRAKRVRAGDLHSSEAVDRDGTGAPADPSKSGYASSSPVVHTDHDRDAEERYGDPREAGLSTPVGTGAPAPAADVDRQAPSSSTVVEHGPNLRRQAEVLISDKSKDSSRVELEEDDRPRRVKSSPSSTKSRRAPSIVVPKQSVDPRVQEIAESVARLSYGSTSYRDARRGQSGRWRRWIA
jgi:hypothetical protein